MVQTLIGKIIQFEQYHVILTIQYSFFSDTLLICRYGHGSNQPDQLAIEYPLLSLAESTPPPTTSKPTAKKVKTKEKAQEKEKAKANGNKKRQIPLLPDSPAMSTRSKTP